MVVGAAHGTSLNSSICMTDSGQGGEASSIAHLGSIAQVLEAAFVSVRRLEALLFVPPANGSTPHAAALSPAVAAEATTCFATLHALHHRAQAVWHSQHSQHGARAIVRARGRAHSAEGIARTPSNSHPPSCVADAQRATANPQVMTAEKRAAVRATASIYCRWQLKTCAQWRRTRISTATGRLRAVRFAKSSAATLICNVGCRGSKRALAAPCLSAARAALTVARRGGAAADEVHCSSERDNTAGRGEIASLVRAAAHARGSGEGCG